MTRFHFTHETRGQRVRFATGEATAAVAAEVALLGAERVMLVAAPDEAGLARTVAEGVPVAVVHDEVRMHVPVAFAERARAVAAGSRADAIVCVGGGSTTGLAKAVALTSGLPIVAVPTTYAGSEATDVWGLTDAGGKTTGVDARVLPRTVVYDAALLTTLPAGLTAASGLNAVAHCVDSMWAPRSDPLDRVLASEGVRALAAGLPAVVADPADLAGREETLYGAYLAAVAFASAGSGLHHKICHVLGGRYDLPHAPTHAVVLPHVLALNAPHAPEAEQRLSGALGGTGAVAGLQELTRRLHAPRALRDLGLAEDRIPDAVAAILPVVPDGNPAPVTPEALTRLLHDAWEGVDPR
jgi:alcohol dehydrogenase class IV